MKLKDCSEVFTVSRKITVSVLALVLVVACIFAGCTKKGEYENPATGDKYEIVTDADGNKVLSDDGELLVYAKDENGEYVTDESGEKVTQVQGFIGQLEENGVVEDYAYKLAVPDGWEFAGNGKFKNKKSATTEVVVSISKNTFAREIKIGNMIVNELQSKDFECSYEEQHFDVIDEDGMILKIKSDEGIVSFAEFMKEGNLFNVRIVTPDVDSADNILNTFLSAITFKPYTYYSESELQDVDETEPATESAEDTTAVTEAQ